MDSYIYVITALLPLAAAMLVFQVNPYHALVIRGVLGAIAALVYTVLGAPDVALTEALVGTLLAITLYAVAVRSSLVFRLAVLKDDLSDAQDLTATGSTPLQQPLQQLVNHLNMVFSEHHLRVELIPYLTREELHRALIEKEVHATCEPETTSEQGEAVSFAVSQRIAPNTPDSYIPPYRTTIRLRRLYDIMNSERLSPITQLSYVDLSTIEEKDS
jgi:putative multicomponent Na+:H+ antiporter subunit B